MLSHAWLFCKPRDCSLPGSSVHGVSQARVLEQVAIFFSKGSSLTRDQTPISCTGRRTLYHCTTWEVLLFIMLSIINKKFIAAVWLLVTLPQRQSKDGIQHEHKLHLHYTLEEATDVVQSLSRTQLFVTPVDCSTPGFPVLHHLPEFAQTHVHWVGDAIRSSHPLLPPSSPALNFSQY